MGKIKKPSYRLIVADSHSPRDGKFIETIGHYDPLTNPATVVVNEEKALYWLGKGAQPTATAMRLLTQVNVIEKFRTSKEKS